VMATESEAMMAVMVGASEVLDDARWPLLHDVQGDDWATLCNVWN
jgi:hypothetical protein